MTLKKQLLIVIFGLLFGLGAAAMAALPAPVAGTLPFYWITGKVTDNGNGVARKVIIYTDDDINKRIEFNSDPVTGYQLNIFELAYYFNVPVAIDATAKYKVAVPRYAQYTTGAEEIITLDPRQGYVTQDLAVIKDGGPVFALTPAGTIPLTISRNGKDIQLNWNPAFQNPQIFVMPGNGSGQFVNNNQAPWVSITGNKEFDDTSPAGLADGILVHTGQVGAGSTHAEAYYKALQAGVKPDDLNPDIPAISNFEAAPAVGKVDISLIGGGATQGYNLICVPLANDVITVDSIYGTGTPWEDGDQILKKTGPTPAYVTAVYDSADYPNAPWRDAGNSKLVPQFNLDTNYGNFVVVKNNKLITVLGKFNPSPLSVSIWGGGYTPLSLIFPLSISLSSSGLIADGAANGDVIYHKTSATSPSYVGSVLVGGAWMDVSNQNNPPPASLATLSLPNSYFYNRLGVKGFSWNRMLP